MPQGERAALPDYAFTTDWFSAHAPVWRQILAQLRPVRLLEIGAYEGRATCFMIETCAADRALELHCIDTWEGGVDNDPSAMGDVERRFDHNIGLALAAAAHPVQFHKHKAPSQQALVRLLADGRAGGFDLVYVDGSHQAADVLSDAVLSFALLRVGGLLIFDDYLWSMEPPGRQDLHNMPKLAIDAFTTIYQRKLAVLRAPINQLYVEKLAP
jgi:predicted O-methyltransferase YrrM